MSDKPKAGQVRMIVGGRPQWVDPPARDPLQPGMIAVRMEDGHLGCTSHPAPAGLVVESVGVDATGGALAECVPCAALVGPDASSMDRHAAWHRRPSS